MKLSKNKKGQLVKIVKALKDNDAGSLISILKEYKVINHLKTLKVKELKSYLTIAKESLSQVASYNSYSINNIFIAEASKALFIGPLIIEKFMKEESEKNIINIFKEFILNQDINGNDSSFQFIYYALINNKYELSKLLIGDDNTFLNQAGSYIIKDLIENNNIEVLTYLIDKKYIKSETLFIASNAKYPEFIKLNSKSYDFPLYSTIKSNNSTVFNLFMNKLNLDPFDKDIFIAEYNGGVSIIDMLIKDNSTFLNHIKDLSYVKEKISSFKNNITNSIGKDQYDELVKYKQFKENYPFIFKEGDLLDLKEHTTYNI